MKLRRRVRKKRNEKMFDFIDSKLTHCCVIKRADITFFIIIAEELQ